MNEESTAVLEISEVNGSTTTERPNGQSIRRTTKIIFGICCYTLFAAMYFLRPNKPVLSFGPLRYTVDSLLEVVLTVLSLPTFFLVYRYGATTYAENLGFGAPEPMIDLLLVTSVIWIALSNGIHLTSKLVDQILTASDPNSLVTGRASVHYLRQVIGHVAQHIGWQMLFAALMLGQLKRPYRGRAQTNSYLPCWGVVFGLLFAQGTIAAGCTALGFTLTLVSCALFIYLAHKSKMPSHETPVVQFFVSGQITFLLGMLFYWSLVHVPR